MCECFILAILKHHREVMKFEELEIKQLLRMRQYFNISEFTYKDHDNTAFWIGN